MASDRVCSARIAICPSIFDLGPQTDKPLAACRRARVWRRHWPISIWTDPRNGWRRRRTWVFLTDCVRFLWSSCRNIRGNGWSCVSGHKRSFCYTCHGLAGILFSVQLYQQCARALKLEKSPISRKTQLLTRFIAKKKNLRSSVN